MREYFADVQRYDGNVEEADVAKIVKYLGIALRRRDSSLVSASDPAELERVREKWCGKKLGVSERKAQIAVERVCAIMAGDRNKSRVTFYYLVAKELGKLGEL